MSVINQQVYASPGALFPAVGGGGGGSTTPNPSFSTISVAPGPSYASPLSPTAGIINWKSTLTFNVVGSQANIYFVDNAFGSQSGIIMNSHDNAANLYLTNDNAASHIYTSYNKPLDIGVLGGGNPVTISSLNVSSINGAAPGGGGSVPGNLSVSSLTLQGDSVAAGGVLNVQATDTDLYTFSVSSATTYADFNLGVVGGRQQFYANTLEAPNFYTSTIKGATGQISLNPDGINQIQIGGTGAPGDIFITTTGGGNIKMAGATTMSNAVSMPTTASISSLTVSSINNAPVNPFANISTIGMSGYQFNQQFDSISFAGGLLQSVSSIFSSATISTNSFFQLAGAGSGYTSLTGNGNTNPVTNSTSIGGAFFRVNMLIDEGTAKETQVPIAFNTFTTPGNSSPAGTRQLPPASWSSIQYSATYTANPAPSYQNGVAGGQEIVFTQFGSHTYKFLYEIDCFLNSGDPGAGYNLVVQWPTASLVGNITYA